MHGLAHEALSSVMATALKSLGKTPLHAVEDSLLRGYAKPCLKARKNAVLQVCANALAEGPHDSLLQGIENFPLEQSFAVVAALGIDGNLLQRKADLIGQLQQDQPAGFFQNALNGLVKYTPRAV